MTAVEEKRYVADNDAKYPCFWAVLDTIHTPPYALCYGHEQAVKMIAAALNSHPRWRSLSYVP